MSGSAHNLHWAQFGLSDYQEGNHPWNRLPLSYQVYRLYRLTSIPQALSDVNGSVGRYSSRLPVCAIVFFGAPHRGLQTTALETLVKSQPTEEMLRELRARSPTLIELNDRFRFVANDIDILTCVELWQTKTAVEVQSSPSSLHRIS